MPQAVTIRSLPRAFELVKGMQAQGLEWGESYRALGRRAIAEILAGQMQGSIDQHLDRMAAREEADRRNGSYPRRLMTELGDIALAVPRTRRFAPVEVIRAYARRPVQVDRMILACFVFGLATRKVGESAPAPLLTLIVGPSESTKAVGKAKQEFAERHDLRRAFWQGLLDYAKTRTKLHAAISPSRYAYISTRAGKSGLAYNYVVWEREAAVELYIDRGKESDAENKAIFKAMEAQKAPIEQAFGGQLEWGQLDNKRACRIRKTIEIGGYKDEGKSDETGHRSHAAAPGAAGWLGLAPAPTFAVMALLTCVPGGDADMMCSAAHGVSPLSGMVPMYILMSAFRSAPWLKLISRRWSAARWSSQMGLHHWR